MEMFFLFLACNRIFCSAIFWDILYIARLGQISSSLSKRVRFLQGSTIGGLVGVVTTIFSSVNSGMCNQFLTHYVAKLLCLEHGYSYNCGIHFVTNGFPSLKSQHEPDTNKIIRLDKSAIRQKGTLHSYPFQDAETYTLNGMLGAMEDDYFPGIVKHPVPRRFHFEDIKENITQYQFLFTNENVLKDFSPCTDLTQSLHEKMKGFQGGILIGIHRRRTDYALWNQGRYMDTDEQILEKINFFRSVCGGRRPVFILCTDEPESASSLSEEPDVFLVNADKEVEWLVLQQTEFIIGAVSTFTFTAAGFKSIPYVFANEIITDNFQTYIQTGLAGSL